MTGDVFEEYPSGFDFSDDPGDVGPEVSGIVSALALSRGAERLAGVSGKHGVDRAPEGSAVKAGEVIPDRSGGEVSGSLGGDDDLLWIMLEFDE